MSAATAHALLTSPALIATVRHTWPGSPNHLLAVILCGVAMVLLIQLGRLLAFEGREAGFRRTVGLAALGTWLAMNTWYALPAQFNLSETLPLHICDLGNLLAAVLFLMPRPPRLLRAVLYFWAFGLTSQGFFTPVVEEGPSSPGYWLFWMNHSAVVGLALYDIAVDRFRPTFRDLLGAAAVTAGYVLIILPINLLGGWNYGFVGQSKPAVGTLIDLLGPWPGRILALMALGLLAFILVYLPWPITRALSRPRSLRPAA